MTLQDGDEIHCRICGYSDESLLWEDGWPNHVICDCCGNESGLGDTGTPGDWNGLSGIRAYRGYWVARGAQWSASTRRPADWDLLEQLGNIPPEWR
ncbi:hypothetical protein [Streptomyces sp. JJ36]|uniref:hypothetical protein n=1 Tax=Streptomyces sp. JJ36 TaxID=2736645 RepID=UPI001F3F51A6|nr:hypothetical protein [Streptomyces sp. JJ36]MCF6524231.1 hypothetical protein [Streptomyces sp. JJ36]